MHITFKRLTLAIASVGLLTIYGCGGGGGGAETEDVDVTVVDGPIRNATVCLDKNFNGACDPDEPSGKTDAAGKVKLKVAKADVNQYPVLAVVAVNNQAPAPGAPPPTALEQVKAFLALFDASLANSFPGTGVSRAAFTDSCYLEDGTTKAVSIALFDQDRVLSGEQNKFRIGSTRTNVQVLAERNITNPDGSKRREVDVQYDVNYLDGTKFSDSNPALVTTLIAGSSAGSVMVPGTVCSTPESGTNLRFFGNRAVVSAIVRPFNERYERYNLATGMPLASAVDYNKWVQFRITDNSNFAKYVIVKGPGLPAAGYKMVSPRIQRDDPLFAGKRGNFVNWLDTDNFRICRNSLNGGNGRDGALADCVGFGAAGNNQGVFNRPADLADSEFAALNFVAGGSYTFAVHNDDGWKTINGQASQTPIATYTRVLRRLPYSAVALAGAGPGSDLYPHITSSKTPVELAAIFRSKLADTTNLSWTALGTMPDGAKYGFGFVCSFEDGPANMALNFWPRSRQFQCVYPANGALSTANFPIPAAAAVLVEPRYAEIGVDYANRNSGFVGSKVSFETVAP